MLFANKIRQLREEQNLLQRQLAAALEIDTPMYSKIERGERPAKREQVIRIAELFHSDPKELLILWLADKVIEVVGNEGKIANEVLSTAKEYIKNKKQESDYEQDRKG